VGRGVPRDDYTAAVERYREIATDLEALRLEEKQQRPRGKRPGPNADAEKDAEGDTLMTGINTTHTAPARGGANQGRGGKQQRKGGKRGADAPRAKWVSDEVRAARQQAGVCIRCGRQGHFVATCPFAPAKRPAPQVDINKLEAEDWVEEDSSSEEEEGKE
jgi:hypothetical protein